MFLDFLFAVWKENREREALIWRDESYSYEWLLERCAYWQEWVAGNLRPGVVVALEADFSPNSMALFLAIAEHRGVLVPLTESVRTQKEEFLSVARCETSVKIDSRDAVVLRPLPGDGDHPLYDRLREAGHPGLVVFSSASTGTSKGAVHDLVPLLEKFKVRRTGFRTIAFLLYDHLGGINTMLHTFSNAGCVITVEDRTPDAVMLAVERHQADLLPVSPTFLNLLLMSEAYKRHDLSSLKRIAYGTEPMPEHTLKKFHELFPEINLQQTYGLSEVGVLRSKSKDADSLWVKVGGEGFETRVVAGILQIKARSAMLGYLNAPSPFTEDGWFDTGDAVETDGEYLRILGRTSEIINVGGKKVYPAEVENVIQELDSVAEVTAYGERNPITGSIVCTDVTPAQPVEESRRKEFVSEVKRHCRQRLESYKVPLKVNIVAEHQHTDRYKKARR
jgi:long-chain acyl-CoA synthetase